MNTFRANTDQRLDLTRNALRHTADAWEHGMRAASEHDVHQARRVLRGAFARRAAIRAALQHVQLADHQPRGHAPGGAASADVLTNLIRIDRLLGQISQMITAAPDAARAGLRERDAIDAARRIGSQRLRYFANTMPRPPIDSEYIAAGDDLLNSLADLAACSPSKGTTSGVCLALIITLVRTSRHATRIA